MEVCIVLPHVDTPTSIVFDATERRLDVRSQHAVVSAEEMPRDVSRLLTEAPSRVLVVTTDSLAGVRSAARADTLAAKH